MRVLKEPEERKNEILDTAEMLFITKGYTKTTVNDILNAIGIAKGTFYYYYNSKEEVMEAVISRFVEAGVVKAKEIMVNPNLTVHEKFLTVLMAQKPDIKNKAQITKELHENENAQMHQKSIAETVLKLTPILTEIVEQGAQKGMFKTPCPKETVEFLLVASLFMFDEGVLNWEQQELIQKIQAFIHIIETTLGAEKGSFSYIAKLFD